MQVITKNFSCINEEQEIFSPLPLKKQSQSVKKPSLNNSSYMSSLNNTSILQLSPQRSCFNYNSPLRKNMLNNSFYSSNNQSAAFSSSSSSQEDCLSDSDDQSNHSEQLISSISKLRHVTSNPIQKSSQFKVHSTLKPQKLQEQQFEDEVSCCDDENMDDILNDIEKELSLNESQEFNA